MKYPLPHEAKLRPILTIFFTEEGKIKSAIQFFCCGKNPYQVLHLITKCSKIVHTIQKLLPLQKRKGQKINVTLTSWENYWRYALDYNIGITPLLFD
jgi:hypothetical protein